MKQAKDMEGDTVGEFDMRKMHEIQRGRVRPVNLALPQVLLVWLAALLPLGLAIVRCRILQASRDVIFEGLLLSNTHTGPCGRHAHLTSGVVTLKFFVAIVLPLVSSFPYSNTVVPLHAKNRFRQFEQGEMICEH